jgi:hypothetical protein
MRVESGLSAHFKEPNGSSRPGVHWAIAVTRGAETHKVLVKALLADDATTATRGNKEYQAQTAMQYLGDQLKSGWTPDQKTEHTIYIGNPLSSSGHKASLVPNKPWWKLW